MFGIMLKDFARDISAQHAGNALIAFIFAATGPIAIMLTVGAKPGLPEPALATWMFGAFFFNGLISSVICLIYRQPMVFLWTIPGMILVGTALENMSFAEVVGAYLACGLLLLVLGASGLFGKLADRIPMPIVMGMVAALLLKFGVSWIEAMLSGPWIAVPMTIAYFATAAIPMAARYCPPMISTLIIGVVALILIQGGPAEMPSADLFITPIIFTPVFSWQAMVELVIPLAITVLFAQNGQGIALLRNAGQNPPVDVITAVCGYGSLLAAWFGAVSTCLTGPVNAMLLASNEPRGHYTGAVLLSLMCALFGLMAPFFTSIMLATPPAFIATLGGLALLNVLKGSFVTAFGGRFGFGALIAFIVTISNITFLNIGAAFWGILAGVLASWAMEHSDFETMQA
ncbi:MAG: benzoate transporter [Alphaproteobacteria bacterium]|nr:benzoate transporter [Alphaproteobacteria bacterium]